MIAVYNPRRSSSIPVVPLEWEGTRYDNIMLATLSRDGTDLRVLVEYDPDLEPRLVQPTRPRSHRRTGDRLADANTGRAYRNPW